MPDYSIDAGDGSCIIRETQNHTATHLSIPITKDALVAGIIALLKDGDCKELALDTVIITKNTSQISVMAGSGKFFIPLTHITQLVL